MGCTNTASSATMITTMAATIRNVFLQPTAWFKGAPMDWARVMPKGGEASTTPIAEARFFGSKVVTTTLEHWAITQPLLIPVITWMTRPIS